MAIAASCMGVSCRVLLWVSKDSFPHLESDSAVQRTSTSEFAGTDPWVPMPRDWVQEWDRTQQQQPSLPSNILPSQIWSPFPCSSHWPASLLPHHCLILTLPPPCPASPPPILVPWWVADNSLLHQGVYYMTAERPSLCVLFWQQAQIGLGRKSTG